MANATDKNAIRRAARREKRNRERYELALQQVMRSPEGQVVLWEFLKRAGLWKTMVANGFEPEQVLFAAGRHDLGLKMLADLQRVDLEAYIEMERVNRAYARGQEQEEEAAQTPSAGGTVNDSAGDTE